MPCISITFWSYTYSISSIYGTHRLQANATWACFHHNSLATRWIVDAVRLIVCCNKDCAMGDWCWCINPDKLLSSVKLYSCLLAWLLAAQRMSVCALMSVVEELCRLPTVFHNIWNVVFAYLCPIDRSFIGALGSALPSTLDSNHVLSNLRTAWQYSQMSYSVTYIDFVNAFTYSPT